MKVNALQLYLRSLNLALAASDVQSAIPAELESACAGLQPFADLEVGQLAAFLRQAEEYRASGVVSVPSQASVEAERVQSALRPLVSLVNQVTTSPGDARAMTEQRDRALEELEQTLVVVLKPLAVSVSFKADKKGFETGLVKARTRSIAVRLREALNGVTDEQTLNAPDRQQQLKSIVSGLELSEIKTVAAELGSPRPTLRSTDSVLAAIVEHLTGLKPAATGAKRTSKAAAVDSALVQQEAVKLKGLMEKSIDPDALSEAEVRAAISELEQRTLPELKAIAEEAGLDNPGKKKGDVLKKIEFKLTETRRARESIQV